MGKLLLLFVVVPLIEALLLAKIGAAIGWMNTILLVLATGVIGAWLFRLEGGRAFGKWQEAVSMGRMPEEGVLSGLLLLLGGALLITPGVVTDAVGLLLLIPQTRQMIARFLEPRVMARFRRVGGGHESGRVRVFHFDMSGGPVGWSEPVAGDVEDGDDPQRGVVVARRAVLREAPRAKVIDADFEVKGAAGEEQ